MGFFEGRTSTPATTNLIIINVLVMIMILHFALFCPGSHYFRPWQFITHMFMHGGFWHIFFNMYTLWMFGSVLERSWGWKKFLLFYFVSGLGAALLHTGVQLIEAHIYMSRLADGLHEAAHSLGMLYATPTVGASGAIYGLLLGFGMLYPDSRLMLLFPPIPLKAKWFVIIFAVIELFTGIFSRYGGIAHFAHLGGMLFGWLLIMFWKRRGTLYNYKY